MPPKIRFQQLLKRYEMGKGSVLFGNSIGVLREDESRNLPAMPVNGFQNLGEPAGIFRLREEQIGRASGCLLRKVAVARALDKVSDVAVAYKVLPEEIRNEGLLDIKDRPHSREIKMHLQS